MSDTERSIPLPAAPSSSWPPLLWAAVGYVVLVATACLVGPWLFSAGQTTPQAIAAGAQPPSFSHWFGTDALGRDVLLRLLLGGRVTLFVATSATLVASVVGVAYGSLAGAARARVESVMMRVVDVLYALPVMLIAMAILAVSESDLVAATVGTRGAVAQVLILSATLGGVQSLTMVRIVRTQTRSLMRRGYVAAARTMGQSRLAIVIKHILPHNAGAVVVYATLVLPTVMLQEGLLSFLGLGIDEPLVSWGLLLKDGVAGMSAAPWLFWGPAGVLAVMVVCLNAVGDAVHDALDPD